MPIAKFQMPDGRVARFEVPEGTTPEQAQQMMESEMASMSTKQQQPAQKPVVNMQQAKGRTLPPLWDVEVDLGDGNKQQVRATFDADANAYLVPAADGKSAYFVTKKEDGTAGLKPYTGKPSALGTDLENARAGAGKAFVDTGRFLKEVSTLGGDDVMQDIRDSRARDQELMGTKAGIAGNVVGHIAQAVAGGTALRGAALGASKLAQGAEALNAGRTAAAITKGAQALEGAGKAIIVPKGYKQAAATGAVIGAAQPFENAVELAKNTGFGAAFGVAGQALANTVGSVVSAARNAMQKAKNPEAEDAIEQAVIASAREHGIDWARLPDARKEQFAAIVKEGLKGGEESAMPEAVARTARAESQGIPITAAQAEKDIAGQIEANRALPYSKDLQNLRSQQRAAIDEKINELVAGTKAPSGGDVAMAGESQKRGMRAFLGTTKQAVKDAYKKAEDEAGDLPVATDGVLKLLTDSRGIDGVKPALMKLRDLGAIGTNEAGDLAAMNIPARDLYQVRKVASALEKSPTTAFMGKELKKAVDAAYDESGIGQYAEAAALRRAQSKQFDERAIPQKLSGRKGQEDLMGDDKLLDWIIRRDTKEIGRYKQALVGGNEALLKPVYKADKEARRLGIQSARDLKAGLMRYIQNQATVKDELSGAQTVSPESFVTAYKRLGGGNMQIADDKARAILGPKLADRLKNLVQTAEDISTPSAAQAKGSARFNEAITRGLGALVEMLVPKVGGMVRTSAGELATRSAGRKMAQPLASRVSRDSRAPSLALAVPTGDSR